MARFPKVDSPCPLDVDKQKRLNGYCNRCHKHVHTLDGMDDAGRAAWLAAAEGPVCVSYRRSSRIASLAAIAITLVAGTAFAGEECADTSPSALVSVSRQQVTPAEQLQGQVLAGVESSDTAAQETELLELVIVGGIRDPREAEWVDDSDLPELPIKVMATAHVDSEAQPPSAKR